MRDIDPDRPPRNSVAVAFERLYDEQHGTGAYQVDEAAIRTGKKPRTTQRGIENEKLRFMVRALFSLDRDRELTVARVCSLPIVREWQEQQGIEDDTLTRIVKAASPSYATGSRGRPNAWDDEKILLSIPPAEK